MTVKLHFDGEKILVPDELRGHAPVDLEATIVERPLAPKVESVRDLIDRFAGSIPRTEAEVMDILREIREGRDDER